MLATSGRPTGSLDAWTAEFKADGFRCHAAVVDGRRVVRTRGGHDITDQLPELAALSDLGVNVVLDGELIVGAGRPADFRAVAGAVSSRRPGRIRTSFLAFDILWIDGSSLVEETYEDRRTVLRRLSEVSDGVLPIVPAFPARDLEALLVACDELDLEGVVMKRNNSTYKPGRSRLWRTVKTDRWRQTHLPARQAAWDRPATPTGA